MSVPRPCTCNKTQIGRPFSKGSDCPDCWNWHHNEKYRKFYGGDPSECVAITEMLIGEQMSEADMREIVHRPVGTAMPNGWQSWPVTIRVYAEEARKAALAIPSYVKGVFSGRGIIIPAGGNYWVSAYVTVKMIRHYGCQLPIQIWHMKNEYDETFAGLLEPLGVKIVDASKHSARAARRIVNEFEVKLFASMACEFEEVLMLDADTYPCGDVTKLFDCPNYRHSGAIYWPDIPAADAWTNWPFWNVQAFGPKVGFETGQYVINKRIGWKPLNLALWYDDHSDRYYGGGIFSDHGDKGPNRVGWAFFKMPPTVYQQIPKWQSVAFVHVDRDLNPLLIHRCRSKFSFHPNIFKTTVQNGFNLRANLPGEVEAFSYFDELKRKLWKGRDLNDIPSQPEPKRGFCKFMGEKIGQQQCKSCQGAVQIHIMGCQKFGKCTVKKQLDKIKCCAMCHAFEARPAQSPSQPGVPDRG